MLRTRQEAMKRKKLRARLRKEPPFPILDSEGSATNDPPCRYFTAYLQGCSVIVQHSGDMDFLYNMGFFGKGNLSRSDPSFDSRQQRVTMPVKKYGNPDGRHRVVQAIVTSKRKYLTHLRYKALSDDEEDAYNNIVRQEQLQLSAYDGEDDEDEEDEDMDEDFDGEVGGFDSSHFQRYFFRGDRNGKLTPQELYEMPRSLLMALMTQSAFLSKEQIATFVRVPCGLAELETKYRIMRMKQVVYLENLSKRQDVPRSQRDSSLKTASGGNEGGSGSRRSSVGSGGDGGRGFGKKGIINLEEVDDDAVVVLNSDDDNDKESDDEGTTKKFEKMKDTQSSVKAWDDSDDEGDVDFWGIGVEKGKESSNEAIEGRNDKGKEDSESMKDRNDEEKEESESKEDRNDKKKEDCDSMKSKNDKKEERDPEEDRNDKEKEDRNDKDEDSCESAGEKENVEDSSCKDKEASEKFEKDGSVKNNGQQGDSGDTSSLLANGGQVTMNNTTIGNVEGDESQKNKVNSKAESSHIQSLPQTSSSSTTIDSAENKSPVSMSDCNEEDNDDDDDVICLEEDSAKPAKLHQYLSQQSSSKSRRIIIKPVTFLSSITEEPKFVSTRLGFKSWDDVLHFNFSGDPNHLPTGMAIHDEVDDKEQSNQEQVITPASAAAERDKFSMHNIVYERVYPPVSSLIVSQNSKGSVMKQRHDPVPFMDVAFRNLEQRFVPSQRAPPSSHLSNIPSSQLQPAYFPSGAHHSSHHSNVRLSQSNRIPQHHPSMWSHSNLVSQQRIGLHSSLSQAPSQISSFFSPKVTVTLPQLQLYLQVFQRPVITESNSDDDDEQEEEENQENNPGDKIETDKDNEKLLCQLRVQLSKTGLLTMKRTLEGLDSDFDDDSIATFNNMLSEYLTLRQISLEQELLLLRILMYDEKSVSANAIPMDVMLDLKSKISPGQVSCFLERMDFVQVCVESKRDMMSSNEVITIDLSDDEEEGVDLANDGGSGGSGKKDGADGSLIPSDFVEKNEKNNGDGTDDNSLAKVNELIISDKDKLGGEKEMKRCNGEGDGNVGGMKRRLDCPVTRKGKKLKSGDGDSVSLSSDCVGDGDSVSLSSDCVGDGVKNDLSNIRDDVVTSSLESSGSMSKSVSENVLSASSTILSDKKELVSSKSESGDDKTVSENLLSLSDNSEENERVENQKLLLPETKNNSKLSGDIVPNVNRPSEGETDSKGFDDVSLMKTNNSSKSGESIVSNSNGQSERKGLGGVLSPTERKDSNSKDDAMDVDESVKDVIATVEESGDSVKKGQPVNVNEEENEIYVGSSDDEEEDEGMYDGEMSGFHWKKRMAVSGNGLFHNVSNNLYCDGDDEDADTFVIANTSDDDEYDVGDDDDAMLVNRDTVAGYGSWSQRRRNQWQPCLKQDPYKPEERLHLMLEEAFFLTYGLGCLRVLDQDMRFGVIQEKFIPRYVAYHYFRSKGWVPKSGLKFGCDFILYREGPPFFHGSYSVMVVPVKAGSLVFMDGEDGELDFSRRWTSWVALSGLNRVTEHVAKELMVCYVIFPKGLTEEESKSPRCLTHFKVKEVVVSRWVSARERETKDQEEEMP